ncbi:sialate O-acetylesterase [Pedobacter frigidisoli]|uniref:sialate O-acetylesterase n=1 Tax=Pedobacter frigidisoli TaxID=2530455 RepID=UPI00292DCC6B|nr:sialate O-acetylesterase [Pedobacter frigidisoli]
MMIRVKLALVCLLFCSYTASQAKVTLPAFFSSNMVLQQKAQINMKGKANPGDLVMLACSWDEKKYAQRADKAGNFKLKIKTPAYGGPYIMVLSAAGKAIKFDNVLIGDVWLCSGQSNMEMPLAGWGKVANYESEIAAANYPNIRLLQVNHTTANFPTDDVSVQNGGWNVCSPASVPEFSSTAYFFAREVYKQTGIPIGLIHSSWGGTVAEAWTSAKTISQFTDFKTSLAQVQQTNGEEDYLKQITAWNEALRFHDKGFRSGRAIWAGKDIADAGWKEMTLPAFFDAKESPGFDGVVWFKKKIEIPQNWKGNELTLSLGTIDDNDITFFDGEEIGRTEGYDRERKYQVSKEMVSPGEHFITVRVFDGGGGGGIYGEAANFYMECAGEKVSLNGTWRCKIAVDFKDLKPMPQANSGANRPTVLYNAMIHPFITFAIKGVIWYQGEANASRASQYETLFPALIQDWRTQFKNPELPFYFAQLAGYGRGEGDEASWPMLRNAQLKTLALPYTGMAVTIDIGEEGDIHPKNKQDVGKRLALIALAKTYHKPVDYSGPVYQTMVRQKNELILTFGFDKGIQAKSGGLDGFFVAGDDDVFYPAKALIKNGGVHLHSDKVAEPVKARYSWSNYPRGNLTNSSGLPASPFAARIR